MKTGHPKSPAAWKTFAGALTISAVALAPSMAAAATVAVEESTTSPTLQAESSELVFDTAAGEENRVTVAPAGEDAAQVRYSLRDAGAGIVAGAGCTGGAAAGQEVTCLVSRSRPASGCNRIFCADYGRRVSFSFTLGDGADVIETAALGPDGGNGSFALSVSTGEGNDQIDTGQTFDTVDPGPGADQVSTGAGIDLAHAAEPLPDGADLLDLGQGFDQATYGDALAPVEVSLDGLANDGGAGEQDNVTAAEWIHGGSAADLLVGSDNEETSSLSGFSEILDGAGGADVIFGNGGDDSLYGGANAAGSGDDVISGGSGDDSIIGSDGEDEVDAGSGRDLVVLGPGADRGGGAGGSDKISGNGGSDRLRGGIGANKIFAGSRFSDASRDRVNCGTGTDEAHVEPRDRTRACEKIRLAKRI